MTAQRSRSDGSDQTVSVGAPESGTQSTPRPPGSRLLHKVGELSESTPATVVAALTCIAFLLAALIAPRATPWLTAFEALAAAVTLVMVFALHHTQSRQQAALQRKLDEILRVLPGADPRLVQVETASDHELADLGRPTRDRRDVAADGS